MADTWRPDRYERFRTERDRPVRDLLGLIEPMPGGRLLDLGCGTGELTRRLHDHVGASETVGVDTSPAMLERAVPGDGVRFELADLAGWSDDRGYDLVFANASLQWVPDHRRLLPRLWRHLRPAGRLAVQVPANFHHPSHTVADAVGRRHGLPPLERTEAVLSPGEYATVLHDLGATDEHVRLVVYGARLEHTREVLDWVEGSLLTHHRRELGPERYADFLEEYRTELLHALGDPGGEAPCYYPFERILMTATRPTDSPGPPGGPSP